MTYANRYIHLILNVAGKSILRNRIQTNLLTVIDHGFTVCAFNRTVAKGELSFELRPHSHSS